MTSLDLGRQVRRGVAWSTLNSAVLRIGTFATGVALARLLTPQEFGVYAVALTVQLVLMTLADLGLSADLVRHEDPARRAPTVAVLGVASGGLLALLMVLSASRVASLMGDAAAAPVIAVLSMTLVLGGAGVVPYAMLVREFRQRELFLIALIDFVVSTTVTVTLVVSGWGPMALADGRVVAQVLTLVLQFKLSGTRPAYRVDRTVALSVLAFGAPVALANMLSWGLLNVDNIIIARIAGTTLLGFYVLAFNVSNWPMSVIGQVARSVALPAFARAGTAEGGLVRAVALTWGLALPAGAALAALAGQVVRVVYGDRWVPAAPVLVSLALFGSLRVLLDIFVSFLLSRGRSRSVLIAQVVWIASLVPALVLGTSVGGIAGAGWAHLAVTLVVIVPTYAVVLARAGVSLVPLARVLVRPAAATAAAVGAALVVVPFVDGAFVQLVAGGCAGAVVYALLAARWLVAAAKHPGPGMSEPGVRIDTSDQPTSSITTHSYQTEGSP